jgi:CheY-like chemotaxis protein
MGASDISTRTAPPDSVPNFGEPGRSPIRIDALRKEGARIHSQSNMVRILSVSPAKEDHVFLAQLFRGRARWPNTFDPVLSRCSSLEQALRSLRRAEFSIVLCDRDVAGTWQQLMRQIRTMPNTPFLIVTSRLADDHLWAEALNLGAYDVLAKPYDADETVRVITSAWMHWTYQQEIALRALRMAKASWAGVVRAAAGM